MQLNRDITSNNMNFESFVEVTRNNIVESRHSGAAVICDHFGKLIKSWGNISSFTFPRSALKPILAIPLVESGASDFFSLGDVELSLACSSHEAEKIHQDGVKSWLTHIGLTENHLACGATLPSHTASAHQLLVSGKTASRLYHNCSGKHTGFLATAIHLNFALSDYHLIDHPVQQLGLDVISDLMNDDVRQYPIAVDGCGIPAPTMPLLELGKIAARFSNPATLSTVRIKAIKRLQLAMINKPFYLAGHDMFASCINEITNGKVIAKTGAEGVLIAFLPDSGLGIALKIADGNDRASPVALLAILDYLKVLTHSEHKDLENFISPILYNSRGIAIGEIRRTSFWLS